MLTLTTKDLEKINNIKDEICDLNSQIKTLKELLTSDAHRVEVRDLYPDGVSDYLLTLNNNEIKELLKSRENTREALLAVLIVTYGINLTI